MTGIRREQIFDFVRRFLEERGYSPSCDEIGEHFGITGVGAWKHVKGLLEEGRLIRKRGKYRALQVPGRVDLRPVPTGALVAELARRRAVGAAQRAAR